MLYPKGLSARVNTGCATLPSIIIFLNIYIHIILGDFFIVSGGYRAVCLSPIQAKWGLSEERVAEI